MQGRRSQISVRGVTLIELLMVIIVMAVAATVVVAMMGSSDEMRVDTAVRQVAAALFFAQTYSISTQQPCQVVFDTSGEAFELQDAAGNVIDTNVNPVIGGSDDALVGRYRVAFSENAHLSRVEIVSADFDGSQTVWFDSLGAPYGGTIVSFPAPLTSGSVTVGVGDTTATVGVEPVTGRLTVSP